MDTLQVLSGLESVSNVYVNFEVSDNFTVENVSKW